MKRSAINAILREADGFIRAAGHILPPFASLTPSAMQANARAFHALADRQLGWDITDFGSGDFARIGLVLFTTRNRVYAEKLMVSRRDQLTPMHRHVRKTEDIVNRGGGTLAVRLFTAAPDGSLDETLPVRVETDGILRTLAGGDTLRLAPGESVTLLPGMHWHAFRGEDGDVLVGEVSTVNDDATDNVFHDPVGRYASFEEDEPPVRLLASDYPTWLR